MMPQVYFPGATRFALACWYCAGRGDGIYLGTASSQLAPMDKLLITPFPRGLGSDTRRDLAATPRAPTQSSPVKPSRAQSNPTQSNPTRPG